VSTLVVSSPVATINDNKNEIDATDEGEQQQPQIEDVPNVEAPRRS
jgi:hypothetical protein